MVLVLMANWMHGPMSCVWMPTRGLIPMKSRPETLRAISLLPAWGLGTHRQPALQLL